MLYTLTLIATRQNYNSNFHIAKFRVNLFSFLDNLIQNTINGKRLTYIKESLAVYQIVETWK